MISTEDIRRSIRSYADRSAEQKAHLTRLDSPIGNGDHGQNMDRGMPAAVRNLDGSDTPGAVLKTVAMGLISKTGGASGPLYGTFFLDASKQAPEEGVDLASLAAMMRGGLDGVKRRGNAEPDDKTMVDAIPRRSPRTGCPRRHGGNHTDGGEEGSRQLSWGTQQGSPSPRRYVVVLPVRNGRAKPVSSG